jgi:hypothetical protein
MGWLKPQVLLYQDAGKFESAEQAYPESLNIKVRIGNAWRFEKSSGRRWSQDVRRFTVKNMQHGAKFDAVQILDPFP